MSCSAAAVRATLAPGPCAAGPESHGHSVACHSHALLPARPRPRTPLPPTPPAPQEDDVIGLLSGDDISKLQPLQDRVLIEVRGRGRAAAAAVWAA